MLPSHPPAPRFSLPTPPAGATACSQKQGLAGKLGTVLAFTTVPSLAAPVGPELGGQPLSTGAGRDT